MSEVNKSKMASFRYKMIGHGKRQSLSCINIPIDQYFLMKQKIKLLTKSNKELLSKNNELKIENEYLKSSLHNEILPDTKQYIDAGQFPKLQKPKLKRINSTDSNISLNSGNNSH
mmetsp:Transcript_64642/g.79091  ORF Transcript_64642/g.79091 Transcript_64642/m.79091 type:complete len:115 (+) Transcript_64642:47-391(+)